MTNTESTVWADQNSQFSPKANSLGMKVNLIQLQVFHWRWVAFFQCQDFATAQVAAVKRKDLSSHRLWEKKILLQSTNETQTFQFYKKHICLWCSLGVLKWISKCIFEIHNRSKLRFKAHFSSLQKSLCDNTKATTSYWEKTSWAMEKNSKS